MFALAEVLLVRAATIHFNRSSDGDRVEQSPVMGDQQ